MNIVNKKLNLSSFSNSKQVELEKAYTEGVYCDSPANRKLGRVGMTYQAYAEKVKKENPKKQENLEEGKLTRDNLKDFLKKNEVRVRGLQRKDGSYDIVGRVTKIDYDNSSSNSKPYEVSVKWYGNGKTEKKSFETFSDLNNWIHRDKMEITSKENNKPKKENKINFNIEDYKTIPSKNTLEKLSLEELKRNLYSTGLQIDSCKMDLKKTKLLGAQRREFFNKKQDSIERGETLKKTIEKIIKDKKAKKEEKSEEKKENNKKLNIDKILEKSDDLGRAKGKRLDAIISYAEFDNVPKNATDEEKRKIIAENYIKSAELNGTPEEIANDLDEIIEDAIADYVPPKKKDDTEEKKKLSYIEARTVLNYSDTLANATTRQLNNVIDYSGFNIDKNLSDDEKREKLAQKYYASADLYELTSAKEVADALDGIIEDALEDYVPPKK